MKFKRTEYGDMEYLDSTGNNNIVGWVLRKIDGKWGYSLTSNSKYRNLDDNTYNTRLEAQLALLKVFGD